MPFVLVRLLCLIVPLACLGFGSCAITPPSTLAERIGSQPAVLVKSLRIPDTEVWYSRFAQHSWLDVRMQPDGVWIRLEIETPRSGVTLFRIPDEEAYADRRWGRAIHVRKAVIGEPGAEIAKQAIRLTRNRKWPHYQAYPGPNSNTYVAELLEALPEIGTTLDANAVGKDFQLRVGKSETGSGVEADAYILGLQLGLQEGIELHLLGFTLGLGLQPLTLKLPFVPELRWMWGNRGIEQL